MMFSALLLAAGLSQRMGAENKLALPVDGVPLLRRTAKTLVSGNFQEIVCVLGHEEQVTRPLVEDLDMKLALNPHYKDGQMSSVHWGLQALEKPCDAVLVCLSDLVFLQSQDLEVLCAAFEELKDKSILVPTHKGERGNPIILSAHHRAEIMQGKRNLGCKKLIQKNPELVSTIEMPDDRLCVDMDTPEAYEQVLFRLQTQKNAPKTQNYKEVPYE